MKYHKRTVTTLSETKTKTTGCRSCGGKIEIHGYCKTCWDKKILAEVVEELSGVKQLTECELDTSRKLAEVG